MPQILPVLNENGLVLTQFPTTIQSAAGAESGLRTRITHAPTGEFIEDTMPLVLDKNNSQGQGSAITYARRYAVLAILGLVADADDDGTKASAKPKPADPVAALKKQVLTIAKEQLGKDKPSASEVAKFFGVTQAELADEAVLTRLIADGAV